MEDDVGDRLGGTLVPTRPLEPEVPQNKGQVKCPRLGSSRLGPDSRKRVAVAPRSRRLVGPRGDRMRRSKRSRSRLYHPIFKSVSSVQSVVKFFFSLPNRFRYLPLR